jgi:hypothetical protein
VWSQSLWGLTNPEFDGKREILKWRGPVAGWDLQEFPRGAKRISDNLRGLESKMQATFLVGAVGRPRPS